jgi:hypothetical protein
MSDQSFCRSRLLQKYPSNTVGRWRIVGEDPNCDMGGAHGNPHLETVTGTYRYVVEYAVALPGFFRYGYGGDIIQESEETQLKNIDTVMREPRIQELREKKESLLAQLREVGEELIYLERLQS